MSFSACYTTSTICKGCRDTVGGVKAAYIFGGPLSGITISTGETITTIGADPADLVKLYEFQVEKNTSSFVENITTSLENGTVVYEQLLNLVFHKLQTSTRNQLKLLAQNTDLKVIVLTNDGSYWYLGENFGMALSTGTAESGTAFSDRNAYAITLQGFEKEPAMELGQSLSATLVGITLELCS
jgi:hypothetical protein